MRLTCLKYDPGVEQRQSARADSQLLEATSAAITRWGLRDTTLERIGAEAGLSRATMYRRGLSRDDLIAALVEQAAVAYRSAVWPALTNAGAASARLADALQALCDVADAHLHLLAGMFLQSGQVFHRPGAGALVLEVFAEPFERLLRDGAIDGTLRVVDPQVAATTLFNVVGWGYVHLRVVHEWPPQQARPAVVDLAVHGLVTPSAGT
jgi:AcrR family transcriptional regulator